MASVTSITNPDLQDRTASVLHIWRSAADAIQSDRTPSRREAYAQAVAAISAAIPPFTRAEDLIAYYWSGQMQARAALASISRQGHVLNYQVIAAAACWQALNRAMRAQ